MTRTRHTGAEEARKQFSDLLSAAEAGRSTIITKHGRPVAALIPVDEYQERGHQQSLLGLEGSGRGLWGNDSPRTIEDLRDEWIR